jgi:hypothetical protein
MKKTAETAATMSQTIGKTGRFHHGSLEFDVQIHDVRLNFGRTDYFIKPTHGRGEQWVSSDRVTVN